jgi:polyisoprenoid-binding protein YceI
MKKIVFTLLAFISIHVQAQTLRMSDETSEVRFVTRHLASPLEGTFKGVDGTANINLNELSQSTFRFAFAAGSIQGNDNYVGLNFVQESCFNTAKYPSIELVSSAIKKLSGENKYLFNGQLKIKGVSRFISFPMTITQNVGGYDFNFAFTFHKKDFNVKCGTARDFKITVKTYAKQV